MGLTPPNTPTSNIDKPVLRAHAVQNEPVGTDLLKRLESMEADLTSSPAYTGHSRWMIPYADMLTLLLGFFMVLFALSQLDQDSLKQVIAQLKVVGHEMAEVQQKQGSLKTERTRRTEQTKPVEHKTVEQGKNTEPPDGSNTLLPSGQGILERSPESALIDDPQTATEQEAETSQLEALLADRLNDTDAIEIHQQERGVVITVKDHVLFETGKANISPAAKSTLDDLADALQDLPNPIRIEGHTDNTPVNTPQYPSNWELSTARATRILKYLITSHDLDPTKLSAIGYGEFRPISENSTTRGKQMNRRVDIVVMNGAATRLEPPAPEEASRKILKPDHVTVSPSISPNQPVQ